MDDDIAAKLASLEPLNREFAAALLTDLGYVTAMATEGSRQKARADKREAAAA